MDIEKLIEQLNRYFEGETLPRGTALDAATALSTLQEENEKLRVLAELGNMRAKDYRVMRDRAVNAEAENEKLRAELKEAEMKIDSLLDEEEKVAFYPFGVEKED